MSSIQKISSYDDGYNLYRMDVKYDYNLDDVINYGIADDQSMIDAILKEALPLLPVKIKAPKFGCTAFTMTDTDGDIHMGRNYDFKKILPQCSCTVHRKMDINLLHSQHLIMYLPTFLMRM